ncbi:UNVERIFIED_CONTAM: hypothetical protein GTU68_057950 [Idotea baltica]|nr:hypothetical protein [Idotea baltica]
MGVTTAGVAEQLAAGVQEDSDAQELFHSLATAGGAFAPYERLKEYELEAERLHARNDHLRAQNDVLGATLSESKACCDRLALRTGGAEARSGALKMGVEVLDQIQEAFEVLTTLQEARIALLVVTCQVTGVDLGPEMGFEPSGAEGDPVARVRRAQEARRTAENVARHWLSRFREEAAQRGSAEAHANGVQSMRSVCYSLCSLSFFSLSLSLSLSLSPFYYILLFPPLPILLSPSFIFSLSSLFLSLSSFLSFSRFSSLSLSLFPPSSISIFSFSYIFLISSSSSPLSPHSPPLPPFPYLSSFCLSP